MVMIELIFNLLADWVIANNLLLIVSKVLLATVVQVHVYVDERVSTRGGT